MDLIRILASTVVWIYASIEVSLEHDYGEGTRLRYGDESTCPWTDDIDLSDQYQQITGSRSLLTRGINLVSYGGLSAETQANVPSLGAAELCRAQQTKYQCGRTERVTPVKETQIRLRGQDSIQCSGEGRGRLACREVRQGEDGRS